MRRSQRAWPAPAVLVSVLITVATACATGERPTLVDAATDDPAAAAVRDRLASAAGLTFTATYTITPTSSGAQTQATVRVAGTHQQITIGDVDFSFDGTSSRTCSGGGTSCVDGMDDARVSGLHVTHEFWGASLAARVETDAARDVGSIVGRAETIANHPATCADITLPTPASAGPDSTGVVTYCALDVGPLARYIGADVVIELTSLTI